MISENPNHMGQAVKDAYTHSSLSDAKINAKERKHILDEHTKKINKSLVYGWFLLVVILLVSYFFEYVKGERTIGYLVRFILVTLIPCIGTICLYLNEPDRHRLRYEFVVGYFIMYVFVMITGNTPLVFVYILPFLSFLILYHEPKIILITGAATLIVNLISIYIGIISGDITVENSRDSEIQIALLILCFLGSYVSSRLYDKMHKQNLEYTNYITAQNHAMQEMTMQTIMTIANTIDAKDEYTRGHSRRVAEYASAISLELGFSEKEAEDVRFIGLLHDIGKIGIPDSVLNKPGRLTDEEYEIMKSHTTVGSDILKDIAMIKDLDTGAKYHHERPDGKGYPEGLRGGEIPFIARIISVADAYDAMSSNRIYRRHLEPERVLSELKKGNGTQWDKECCDAMIRLIEQDRLPKVNIEDSEELNETAKLLARVIDKAEDKAIENSDNLDSLTGSYGREQGKTVIQEAIYKTGKGCFYVFDIDHFRHINEAYGFVTGDMYLKALTDLIRSTVKRPIISRFGADVFIVYDPDTLSLDNAEEICHKFFNNMTLQKKINENINELSVSIGITEIMTEKDQIMVLYENATKALYVAKQLGGNNYFFHTNEYVFEENRFNEAVDLNKLVDMIENIDHLSGGVMTVFPEFEKMYEYMSNLAERNKQQIHIILFTIYTQGNVKASVEERDKVMDLLQSAVMTSIRNVDITTKYSSTQQAVLMLNVDEEQLKAVTNRIMTEFYRTYDDQIFTVKYDTADLSRSRK